MDYKTGYDLLRCHLVLSFETHKLISQNIHIKSCLKVNIAEGDTSNHFNIWLNNSWINEAFEHMTTADAADGPFSKINFSK